MRIFYTVFTSILLLGCNSKDEKLPEFISNDIDILNEYVDNALQEADVLLDSLENTPILNTEI